MEKGTDLIEAERKRQVDDEGYTFEHDAEHLPGDLAAAGRSYALYAWWQLESHAGWSKKQLLTIILEQEWPFDERWWKPSEDPIRNLVKAGALIAAEIDARQRKT